MRAKLYRGWYYAVWTEAGRTRRLALRTKDREAADRIIADFLYNRGFTRLADAMESVDCWRA